MDRAHAGLAGEPSESEALYTGRLHRLHPRKTEVRIFDYVDRSAPMLLKMFENRLQGYRAIGYARDEAPLGFAPPPPEELAIEYDEDE